MAATARSAATPAFVQLRRSCGALLILVCCQTAAFAAGWDDDPPVVPSPPPASPSPTASGWWRAAWGTPPSNGVFYMPAGLHHYATDPKYIGMVGGIYKALFGMTFTNSYDDRTWALGIQRDFYHAGRLRLGYAAGLMYGYHGRLAESHRFPLQNTFLFTGDVNPVIGVPVHIDTSTRLQLEVFITPIVSLLGIKVRIGE